MAGSLVGGAALGLAFDILFKAVTDASCRVVAFRSDFENLNSTLVELKPVFNDIQKLNELNDARQYETEMLLKHLEKGEALIRECSKIKRHQLCKKWWYSMKLEKWEKSLTKFVNVHLPIQSSRDIKKTLSKVNVVDEKIDGIHEIVTDMRNIVISPGFRIGSGCADVPAVLDSVVGLDMPLQELKNMVLKDDEREPVVVVSAPGGCGKTTLAKKLCHNKEIKTKYKHISFVTVSSVPNLRDIVEKIYKNLNNGLVPDFRSDEDAINQLQHLLRRHLVSDFMLLVLDDVWPESYSVIENLTLPKCKILVTSRCEFPRFKHTYKLQLLTDSDAMTLFCNAAFADGKPNVQRDLVDKVVKSCGGFPLALKVVGGSLYKQHQCKWINRIEMQTKSQILFSSGSKLLYCLQPSIITLEETWKDCFLDLGLFLEDQRIPATVLFDMWVELYNLNEDGVEAFCILVELASRNLIDLAFRRKDCGAYIGFSNTVDYVSQHDVLRELAIHLSANEAMSNRRRLNLGDGKSRQTSVPPQTNLLSISSDESLFSNWHDLQVPNLEVLLLNLQTTETSCLTLPNFLEKASQLKVLIVTNHGFSPAKFTNFTQLGHLQNLKRIRLERVSFSSICQSTFELVNLRKISLVMCEIGDAFQDSVFEMPNLVEINIEYCDDLVELPIGICNLVHLKTLSIRNCQKLESIPEELGNLVNLESLMLHSCSELKELPASIGRLCKLSFLDIYECMDLELIPPEIGELRCLEKIFMGGRHGLDELPDTVQNLVQLKSVVCDEETSYLWEDYKVYLKDLTISIVKDDMNLNWLHRSSCLGNL